jgi:hypothetical protein
VSNTNVNFNINVIESEWKRSASVLQSFRDFKKAYCSVALIEVCLNGNYNEVKAVIRLYDSFAVQEFLNSKGGFVALCRYCVASLL